MVRSLCKYLLYCWVVSFMVSGSHFLFHLGNFLETGSYLRRVGGGSVKDRGLNSAQAEV